MIASARRWAHKILRDVHTKNKTLGAALEDARKHLNDPRDRALARAIAAGTLRQRGTIDYLLSQVSSRPIETIDPVVLDLLRAAVFQCHFLDRVPTHAAVNDAVDLSREVAKTGTDKFINGVLRALIRSYRSIRLPAPPDALNIERNRATALEYLSTTLSHPKWLVERWLDRHGFEAAEKWALFNNEPSPVTIHANQLLGTRKDLSQRLAAQQVLTRKAHWCPDALTVTGGVPPLDTASAKEGRLLVQDEAAQLVSKLVSTEADNLVLDLCASPGSKTVGISGAMFGRGLLIATDLRTSRLNILKSTISRCKTKNVRLVRLDATAPLPFSRIFDRVLVDVPCSGLGTLRSNPDIKWRHTPNELISLSQQQETIIRNAASVIRPGGFLVYATCSSEPEENEHVVHRFLKEHSDFGITRPADPVLTEFIDSHHQFKTFPFRHDLQAFYGVVMQRRASPINASYD